MKIQFIGIVLATLLLGCSQNRLKSAEGFMGVVGGKIWYEVSGVDEEIPIVVLHGGPGYPSYSLSQLKELSNTWIRYFHFTSLHLHNHF